ncbi:uncharacterized protein LOC131605155 [Vicia villosa]|uniref:uncharacterized protein LOC131605155 n=1 Tax=Vicia villosa TaxID=3911 RepID=UPI00273CBDA5|nr:uncharacterized protein LOC131605155 [Vicia villosa]
MYFVIANKLLRRFDSANIRHIPRQENQEANDLAQEASGYKRGVDEEPVQVREKIRATVLSPSDLFVIKLGAVNAENFEIFTVDNGQRDDWLNGQVEAANKVIISLIKKHVGNIPKTWHKSLSQALWECRTSPKEATGATPFRLTYGHDVVLPLKVYVQSVRIQRQREIPSGNYWSMMTDELIDLDEERMLSLDSLRRRKDKVARAYNKKVRNKVFVINDLIWKVILLMDRNDRFLGKWSPNWEGPFKVIQVFTNNTYEL